MFRRTFPQVVKATAPFVVLMLLCMMLVTALPAMPDAGGVAVGVDRLLMLLTGAREIGDVLCFPAAEEYPHARRA